MKKYLLLVLLIASFLMLSFRCTTSRWIFAIELDIQNEEGEKIDNLEIRCVSNTANKIDDFHVYPKYKYVDDTKNIDIYRIELFNCPMVDVPLETKYIEWDKLKSILDNYTIKITDPNGIYKEYNTPILRELIENSEYKDRKLSCYDENGKIVPEMVFSITLKPQSNP